MNADIDTSDRWRQPVKRYLVASAIGHLSWETLQLPLYTIWHDGTRYAKAVAVVHCTLGDVLIAAATMAFVVVLLGKKWPSSRRAQQTAAGLIIVLGIAYTVISEWLNVDIRKSWAYAPMMPLLPWLGTGLSPLLQWIIVPALALRAAFWRNRQMR